ncbi:MAG: hypothetical protein EBX52_03195 [Proteobacteria bacterium]|nr:hypothetical protein [Pseudomonadota bacterium]
MFHSFFLSQNHSEDAGDTAANTERESRKPDRSQEQEEIRSADMMKLKGGAKRARPLTVSELREDP